MMREIVQAWAEVLDSGERGAMATVIAVQGSAPQVPGARLILFRDGTRVGTVGGGAVEELVLDRLRAVLDDGLPRVLKTNLGKDLGMCCGGAMEVFVEALEGRPRLLLFGAGHVAQPTARIAHDVGFSVTVIDDRQDLNSVARFPDGSRVVLTPDKAVVDALHFTPETFVVIMTHDHRLDEDALRACARQPHCYLGMIGSRRKISEVFGRIKEEDPSLDLSAVHAPIGLDLGAHTPTEIAVSIVAELIAVRHGASGRPLKEQAARTKDNERKP